jgi:hypothetical protein
MGDYRDDGSCAVSPNNPFANWNLRYGSYSLSSVDNTRIETSIYWWIQVVWERHQSIRSQQEFLDDLFEYDAYTALDDMLLNC